MSDSGLHCWPTHLHTCRPQTHGEEELQLQLALAMSREEAEAEDSKMKSDDMRLQMAIQKSNEDTDRPKVSTEKSTSVSSLEIPILGNQARRF